MAQLGPGDRYLEIAPAESQVAFEPIEKEPGMTRILLTFELLKRKDCDSVEKRFASIFDQHRAEA
jgi:hypothetical protein